MAMNSMMLAQLMQDLQVGNMSASSIAHLFFAGLENGTLVVVSRMIHSFGSCSVDAAGRNLALDRSLVLGIDYFHRRARPLSPRQPSWRRGKTEDIILEAEVSRRPNMDHVVSKT
jgi:hypothetical protein